MRQAIFKFFRSFRFAAKGVGYCIKNEQNFRFDMVVGAYALAFSPFFGFTRGEYALLFIAIALVLGAEALNTAVENAVDLATDRYHVLAKYAKDCSAGGVLLVALGAVAIGICLFAKAQGFLALFAYFNENPWLWGVLVITLLASFWFIFQKVPQVDDVTKARHEESDEEIEENEE